ncbi:MAG: hypothetical protein EBT07_04805 [Actinobacteria bacterium]|jgi:hypothetical protein|nr:hypothetical protein [Actinomycetota bacterium]
MLAKRMFRIQYVSDLHLECYSKVVFPLFVKPAARYLALAGDIGQPGHRVFESFLQYVSWHWDHVFFIPGTKEYSTHRDVHDTHAALSQSIDKYKNIHYLHYNNPSFTTKENVTILGATMWPRDVWYPKIQVKRIDFEERYTLGPAMLHPIQRETMTMLETQIRYNNALKQPICMLTHHVPSKQLISSRFSQVADAERLMVSPVKAWIYGKTHSANNRILNGVLTAVNARGYPYECVPGYSSTAYLEFPLDDTESHIYPEVARSAYF